MTTATLMRPEEAQKLAEKLIVDHPDSDVPHDLKSYPIHYRTSLSEIQPPRIGDGGGCWKGHILAHYVDRDDPVIIGYVVFVGLTADEFRVGRISWAQ